MKRTISFITRNPKSKPDFDKIVPLCELYGISPNELLIGEKQEAVDSENNDGFNKLLSDAKNNDGVYGNDVKFSIKAIIGNSGKNYGTGVYLDSNTLSTLNTEERVSKVKNYITHLGGRLFSAFDNYGKEVKIKIAPKSKYKNEKGNWERANRHLTNLIAKEELISGINPNFS